MTVGQHQANLKPNSCAASCVAVEKRCNCVIRCFSASNSDQHAHGKSQRNFDFLMLFK